MKFYICKHCGNVIVKLEDSGVGVVCCGEEMEELTANTIDASKEKHVPVVNVKENGVEVKVGEVEHPMVPNHYIRFIVIETNSGFMYQECKESPTAWFPINPKDVEIQNVYCYCNLHGLWKK